ncbi:hypothetical protein GZ77_11025 [Endozoicomonas montiporae]|uniref:Sulfurtransferase n=2 Tax=Endozoicomonas montiporae TaxID=1027273 RepID=A0A081N8M9_9GAMM|nr:rhodanese-like domain-containing protein [Endozoicomonas montiporae]AMO55291.1 thiosulfate sulfurtransferase [Endozoicomonas montiporae CL-33]KEQ14802.1 hypothetical protein GZ77_11025 [Endozoicomonas montiporae]
MKKTLVAAAMAALMATPAFSDSAESETLLETSMSAKLAEYAQAQSFVSASMLYQLLETNENTVVIGVLDPGKGAEPISGSHTLWRYDYSSPSKRFQDSSKTMQIDTEAMTSILGQFGASEDSTIVVYAQGDLHDAFRLYWQIKMLGHSDVRYLDGGLDAWVAAGYPTGDRNVASDAAEYKAQNVNTIQLATYEMVRNAVDNPDWVILDVRTAEEYAGTSSYFPGATRAGVIPSSQWVEWTNAQNEDGSLKSLKELEDTYGKIVRGKKVIVYCHTGVRAAHTAMMLSEALGADDVHVYDGSWTEWSHLDSAQDH